MPPKQATLGYVRSKQQTLGCLLLAHHELHFCTATNAYLLFRKFFGRPTGSSPKPQQSKLAFKKPHTTKAVNDEHEEVDEVLQTEDREEADAVKNNIADEDVDMDCKSEVNDSAMSTSHASPVMNGKEKVDPTVANGKGEMCI